MTHARNSERNPSLDLIKWAALALMVGDHFVKIFYPGTELAQAYRPYGMMAFPGFIFCYAYTAPHWSSRTVRTVLIGAVLAQIPYSFAFVMPKLNILWLFLLSRLSLPWALLIGVVFWPVLDWGIMGVIAVILARYARLPEFPPVPLPVPRARWFVPLYVGHLALFVGIRMFL
jgi:hypothetical protein